MIHRHTPAYFIRSTPRIRALLLRQNFLETWYIICRTYRQQNNTFVKMFNFLLIIWVEHPPQIKVRGTKILEISLLTNTQSNFECCSYKQDRNEVMCKYAFCDSPTCGPIYDLQQINWHSRQNPQNCCFFLFFVDIVFKWKALGL